MCQSHQTTWVWDQSSGGFSKWVGRLFVVCKSPIFGIPSPKFNSKSPWKMMVGRWVSFWDCLLLGAMLNFGGVLLFKDSSFQSRFSSLKLTAAKTPTVKNCHLSKRKRVSSSVFHPFSEANLLLVSRCVCYRCSLGSLLKGWSESLFFFKTFFLTWP